MTARSTWSGVDAKPTQIGLSEAISPEAFAQRCRRIALLPPGHAAHREMDALVAQLLCSLGYGEGVAIFEEAVMQWHKDERPYWTAAAR